MKPASTSISLRWARRRYLSDRRGSTAIEFAIVAPIFLALMFSTFELGWFYFVNSTVDAAATNAARILRTGQADGVSKGEFFHLVVCPRMDILGDCAARLTVEVKKFDTFSALTAASSDPFICRDAPESDVDNIKYDPSQELGIYRVRLCYLYDTLNPTIGMSLAENDLGQKKVTATYVLRAEPYATSSSADEE